MQPIFYMGAATRIYPKPIDVYPESYRREERLRVAQHPPVKPALNPEVKMYLYVLGALMLLTVLSVSVWSLHLPPPVGQILAVSFAVMKASLVICFFMHLLWESWKPLFVILAIVVVHMLGLLIGTFLTEHENAVLTTSQGGYYLGFDE